MAHLESLLAQDPEAEWVPVTDQLDIHRSEGEVRLFARHCGIDESQLGVKRKKAILKSNGGEALRPRRKEQILSFIRYFNKTMAKHVN